MDIFLFGDQTADQYAVLQKVVNCKHSPVLSTFLERVCLVLREETRRLPRCRREAIPDFLRLGELLDGYYGSGTKVHELESALVTVSQLCHYIGFYEDQGADLPAQNETRSIGLCTGLLAAAAVSSARSLSELIPLAVECVRIAFRTGTCVGVVKEALDTSEENWSTILANTSEAVANEAIDEFHRDWEIPPSNHAYVSAVSVMAVTISGPPSTTQRLLKTSESLRRTHHLPIPVFAPYHAAHLYSAMDIGKILDHPARDLLEQFTPVGRIHSASSGKCHTAANTLQLVECLLDEILREPVRWDHLLMEVVSQVTSRSDVPCNIFAFGATNVANSLVAALKSGGHVTVSVKDNNEWTTSTRYKGRTQNDKIAIVGMAGRFPDAASHEALWDLLMKGLDVHKQVPKDRFDAQAHYDPSGKGKNKSHTQYGCFIDEPGLFDPRFFNMSPREAAQTDPMGRLALVTAYEALEMSGYVPNRTPSTKLHRIGTFYGQTSDDWREINAAEDVDTYFITGGVRAFAPGRINYYFKFSGPSFSVDTACSSSMAAIQLACTSLWAGDCDTACAGGLNVLTNPDIFAGLSKGQFLSKTGSCKTYDNDADGYCRGDGCASVILKRYEDAVADKDHILGSILATSTNHSAEAVSITHPHAGAQEFLYKKILADGGVDAHDVSYVEMHGTGTQAGDGIEMTSVTNAFAPPHRRRRPDQQLSLGAIKANIGHGEASSGVNALCKVLMMMEKNYIPPNVGIKGEMNRTFPKDLAARNVHIPLKPTPFPRDGAEKRLVFLNNFSAAGGNTAALLQDGPLRLDPLPQDPRPRHIITITARAISSLKKNINNALHYLSEHPDTNLSSLSYTTTARRIQHNYRVAFCATSTSELGQGLQGQLKESYSPVPLIPTSTAFVFTGQGSQYVGIAKGLYEGLQTFRDDIDWLDGVTKVEGFPSFLPLLYEDDIAKLSPVVVQLGLSCIQVCLARMWSNWGLKPITVIGHSLGEYAALQFAQVISASDMIRLVGRRAQLLLSMCVEYSHGMLAVRATEESIRRLLGPGMLEVACRNGPEETVLSGSMADVQHTSDTLTAQNVKSTLLRVPFAFHSSQVQPIMEAFTAAASSIVYHKPTVPILSPSTGEVIRDAGIIGPAYLARHARDTVDFRQALAAGKTAACFTEKTAWLEIGAHPVCLGMVKTALDSNTITAASLRRNEDPWRTVTASLVTLFEAGVYLNFDEYHREFNDCHELLVLPTYCFDNKNYWLDYHNNWTLKKGEGAAPDVKGLPTTLSAPTYSTTSCQRIVHEDLQANTGTVVFQSDLAEPNLAIAVSGHLVNDNPLCPSSLYADQALTVADYLYKQLRPRAAQIGLNVCKMEVPKPLIAKLPAPPEGQHIQIEGVADLEAGQASLRYRSVTPDGKVLQEHAHCSVKYEDIASWNESWSMSSYMVKTQIDMLRQKLSVGAAHQFQRGMAYKLFKNFVNYAPEYRGMEQVVCDARDTEASATISFQSNEEQGNYVCAPYWIDSLCHISGFILNGTDLIDSENFLYISHGWGSMKFSKPFSATKKYTNYVRMIPQAGNVRAGDVYIFEGDELIGVCGALRFQQIPRRVMNAMLPPPNGASTALPKGPATPSRPAIKQQQQQPHAKTKSSSSPANLQPRHASEVSQSIGARVMKIIAEETDVNAEELVDDAAFENLGVDSLLSLTISAKLREDLDLDIPANLFIDNDTVGALKKYFSKYDHKTVLPDDPPSDDTSDTDGHGSSSESDASTALSTPPDLSESGDKPTDSDSEETSIARQVITEEMGVQPTDIGDQADLSDLGMDSLMSLTILGSLRERTGVDLPASFLITNTTIEEIEEALGMRPKPKAALKPIIPPTKATPNLAAPTIISPPPAIASSSQLRPCTKDMSKYPRATSVLLQGSTKTATKKLFLFPDGSGSATSYIHIPNLGPSIAIYGLNCPFMKTPAEFTTAIGIPGVAALYAAELRRRQREGPYILGGWSAGGVVAYEVAVQLLAVGATVSNLILMDSPCPIKLEPLPARLHHFFDSIGLLGPAGAGSSPGWLLPHFESSIKALEVYEPQRMPVGVAPPTFAIWAKQGVCGNPGDPKPEPDEVGMADPRPMRWLLENREDFGDNGWAELLPGDGVMVCEAMDGHHFSMTRPEHAATLGALIKKGLGVPQ